MSNVFRNALVLSETVVGSIIDQRSVVLYEQPEKLDWTNAGDSIVKNTITDNLGNVTQTEDTLLSLIDKRKLKELFTGFGVPYLSKINGFNMYGISYMEADVDITSDLCDHPVETGSVITDNAIVQPISAKVKIAMPTAFAQRIYAEMIKFYQQKKYIILQTKFAAYRNMVIESMPFKLENATVDRPQIELSLRQVMEVEPQYINAETIISSPLYAEDSDTKDLGRTRAKAIEQSLGL